MMSQSKSFPGFPSPPHPPTQAWSHLTQVPQPQGAFGFHRHARLRPLRAGQGLWARGLGIRAEPAPRWKWGGVGYGWAKSRKGHKPGKTYGCGKMMDLVLENLDVEK